MTEHAPEPRLLVVEDDDEVGRMVAEALGRANLRIDRAPTAADARRLLTSRTYHCLILDLGLPDGNGLELARTIRRASDVPIIMLTAQVSVPERLAGFAYGADDYICKPFATDELLARVQAVLRRSRPERQHMLRYAGLELDLLQRIVRHGEIEAVLSEREAALLAYLIRHAGEPLSRETLAQEVWGLAENEGGIVNVYINYLRNKLERGDRQARVIHTVRGVGYVLSEAEPD